MKTEVDDGVHCRGCGCTNLEACAAGCFWAEVDLCSACAASDDQDVVDDAFGDEYEPEDLETE